MKRYFRKITSPNPIDTYLRTKKYYYNTLSFFIPIYKLNLKSGEVELLLTEANIEIDEERGVAFLPSYSVYKNFNNNYYNYFFIFSKKHIQESSFIKSNHFNYDYLNEILKIEPTNILNKLGYICFCYYEDLICKNFEPLFHKRKIKDKDYYDIMDMYVNLGGDEYITKNDKEDEWLKIEFDIKMYTNHYLNAKVEQNIEKYTPIDVLVYVPYEFITKKYSLAPNAIKIYNLLENRMNKIYEIEKIQIEEEKKKFSNKVKRLIKKL